MLHGDAPGRGPNPVRPPPHPAGTPYQYRTRDVGPQPAVVGPVLATGITFLGNNNQRLRTSANLGQVVSHNMPGYGQMVQGFGSWSRQ